MLKKIIYSLLVISLISCGTRKIEKSSESIKDNSNYESNTTINEGSLSSNEDSTNSTTNEYIETEVKFNNEGKPVSSVTKHSKTTKYKNGNKTSNATKSGIQSNLNQENDIEIDNSFTQKDIDSTIPWGPIITQVGILIVLIFLFLIAYKFITKNKL